MKTLVWCHISRRECDEDTSVMFYQQERSVVWTLSHTVSEFSVVSTCMRCITFLNEGCVHSTHEV